VSIHHVIWRCLEGKSLPCVIHIGGRCRDCGASVEVRFPRTAAMEKPERLWCTVCRSAELKVLSAVALTGP
jgi:hypothetical protein